MGSGVVFWGTLSVLMVAGLVAGQECDPASKVPYETPITADDVTPFLGIDPPPSCSDFELTELLVCQDDVNIKEGCCDSGCAEVVNRADETCLKDLVDLGCSSGAGKFVPVLENLVRRCRESAIPLACPEESKESTSKPAECSPDIVKTDQPANLTALTPLASLSTPPSCGEFELTSLLACMEELDVVEGCCQQQCKDVFKPVSKRCLTESLNIICSSESAEAFPLLKRVALRCHSDPVDLTCEELAEAVDAAGPEAELEDPMVVIEAEVDPVESPTPTSGPSEPPSSPVTFFGPPKDAGSEPASSPTNFFGPSDDTKADGNCGGKVDENADVQSISALLSEVSAKTCPLFNSSAVFDCQKDVSIKDGRDGCCASECKAFMEKIGDECRNEILSTACDKSPEVFHIFERTARRCLDDYEDKTCSDVVNGAPRACAIQLAVLGGALLLGLLLV